ncbi:MAG: hypothetical protein HY315_02650 [Acidobacteria bacterium]|nr:hypothetical protein [Acidobacteriota bacterium]
MFILINTNVLRKAMDDIAAKKGDFTLFALIMPADAPGAWDLVVSAPWLEGRKLKAPSEFVQLLAQSIGEGSLRQFSRVATVDSDADIVKFILANLPVEKGEGELRVQSSDLVGLQIDEAIIFRAKKPKTNFAGLPSKALQPSAQKTRRG